MGSFLSNKSKSLIILELYYLLISIKIIFTEEFKDLKKLSLYDSYFVALDTGLYLYNFNIQDCALIYEFNDLEYNRYNNIINITELYDGNKAYTFCLINEYLFIFNEDTYKLLKYKINEIVLLNDYYYNIMPYKIENSNISFIIALNKDITNLFFYFYNFNKNEGINEPKIILFKNMNIQNKMIRCQINSYSTIIICFYYSKINTKNFFVSTIFLIKEMNLYIDKEINITESSQIKQIKLVISNNDTLFLLNKDISKN